MNELDQRRQYHDLTEEGSFYSEQTPVPNTFRPPAPTFQPPSMAMNRPVARGGGHDNHHASLLNSTLLSLSVEDEMGTLPSLTFSPPSPLSQPSQSLFDENKYVSSSASKSYSRVSSSPSTLSLARKRRQQRAQNSSSRSERSQTSAKKSPPMEEVYMKENQPPNVQQSPVQEVSPNSEDADTFFECVDDKSLSERARMAIQSETHSSPGDSVVSSLDGQPSILNQYTGQPLENIQEAAIGGGDVVRVHESALHALQQLKEELVMANQRNEELTREKQVWKEEEEQLRQEVMALQTDNRQKEEDLERLRENQEKPSESENNDWMEEKKKLEEQARESTRTIKEFRHRILAGENKQKELKGQLDKINAELESALATKGAMEAEIEQAQMDRMELESTVESLRKELAEATKERDSTTSNEQQLEEELAMERKQHKELRVSSEAEIGRLNSSLRRANEALHRLKGQVTPKGRSSGASFDGMQNTSMLSTNSASPGFGVAPTLDSAIADRMARLRDSAERAHLIRGHKRDLARIKADRDMKLRQLESEHLDATKKLTKQLDAKRKSELEELTKKLNEEHESHLEEIEEEHQKRMDQLQKDFERTQEDADENLEDALNKISRLTQDHGREKGRRHALEKSVEDLQRKMRAQQKDMQAKHSAELKERKKQFESEKDTLLGSIQRECNNAFASRRRGSGTFIETTDSVPTQLQGHGYRPPSTSSQRQQQQQQHQHTGPSPLSMTSTTFFPESKTQLKVIAPTPATIVGDGSTAHFIAPSPRRFQTASPTNIFREIGGSPSIISKTYSDMDIDSVLRETEELVQSIM